MCDDDDYDSDYWLSSWQNDWIVHLVHLMNVAQYQVATDF